MPTFFYLFLKVLKFMEPTKRSKNRPFFIFLKNVGLYYFPHTKIIK